MKHGMTHLPKLFCSTCNVPVARSSKTKHDKTIGHLRRLDIIDAEARSNNLRKEILELESTFQRLTIINRKDKERMSKRLIECKCLDTIEYAERLFE